MNRLWAPSFAVAGVLCAAIFWFLPGRADAVVSGWSSPVKVSGTTRHAWFPDVAADDDGNVHVIWSAEYPTPPRLQIDALWYARGSDQRWSEPTDIAVVYVGDALRNALRVDSAGRLHLLYKGFGKLEPAKTFDPPRALGPEDLWYTSARGAEAASINAWLPAHHITRSTLGYYADLEIDSRGVLHALWTESDALGWGLYYANSEDGGATWSPRVALDDRNYVWWYRTHLNVDAVDRIHVTWEVTDRDHLGHTRAAFYARSIDAGRTWTKVRMGGEVPRDGAENAVAGPQQPTVGIDGSGQIVFVYREEETNRVLYRVSADGEHWSAAQRVPGVRNGAYRPYDVYDMVTDSAGHIHFAFVGVPDDSETVGLMHSEWDGHGWNTPQVIAAGPPYPEYPKLAVAGGNRLHLVWFGGDRDSIDRLAVGIWYSTATVSAPRVLNASWPVPLPTNGPANPGPMAPLPVVATKTSTRPVLATTAPTGQLPDAVGGWMPPSSLPLWGAVVPVLVLLTSVTVACLRRSHPSR